jgi:hypothetical protein
MLVQSFVKVYVFVASGNRQKHLHIIIVIGSAQHHKHTLGSCAIPEFGHPEQLTAHVQ